MAYIAALNGLAAVLWVGGLFFLLVTLWPAATPVPLAERLSLLSTVLGRFFLSSLIALAVLVLTGLVLLLAGAAAAMSSGALYAMLGLGGFAIALFGYVFLGPWQRMRAALAAGTLADAGHAMNTLRRVLTIALALALPALLLGAGALQGGF